MENILWVFFGTNMGTGNLNSVDIGPMEAEMQGEVDSDKWRALYQLIGLCLAMYIGAFGSGMVPLSISMNQRQLKTFNCFGAGLLLGTGLAVIIPEGVNSLYETKGEEHQHEHHDHDKHEEEGYPAHMLIGWALVSGFLSMLLVDNVSCCGGMHPHSHDDDHAHSHGYSPNDTEYDYDETDVEMEMSPISELEATTGTPRHLSPSKQKKKNETSPSDTAGSLNKKRTTVAIGLLVHSAVDGVAVGAAKAASSSNHSLEGVIFLAIMMHKVPAAFGLAVFLRSSGLGKTAVRKNLAIFAAAAPMGAIICFLLLHKGFIGVGSLSSSNIAACLLYSGGTFLYVSTVHILGELRGPHRSLTPKELLALCSGCLLPIFLFMGHDHDH